MRVLLSILAFAFATSAASATTLYCWEVEDRALSGDKRYRYLSAGDTYTGSFNLADDGFVAGEYIVTGAVFDIGFVDDASFGYEAGGELEFVDIAFGGEGTVVSGEEVDGSATGPWYARVYDFDWVGGSLTVMTELQDGIIGYEVTVVEGDTYLKEGFLKAYGERVPDNGSTIAFLGFGLIGLCLVKRRRS